MLVRLFAPGEADECAAVLERALTLDDDTLAAFLERLAERIRYSAEPLTAAELTALSAHEVPAAEAQPPPP
jgi:hypothetical protein